MQILGLPLYNGPAEEAVDWIMANGGLMTVPSAPCMIQVSRDPAFFRAMESSTLILPDSGFMTLMWRLRGGGYINRISGYEFLENFLPRAELRVPGVLFRIDPSQEDSVINERFLQGLGIPVGPEDVYVAPMYGRDRIEDPALLARLQERKPKYVLINLGGGVQEFLGAYIQREWKVGPTGDLPVPALLCTGGAIGFFSSTQAPIPRWADRLFLGWLVRTLLNPKRFGPRFARSFALAPIVLRWGARRPPASVAA